MKSLFLAHASVLHTVLILCVLDHIFETGPGCHVRASQSNQIARSSIHDLLPRTRRAVEYTRTPHTTLPWIRKYNYKNHHPNHAPAPRGGFGSWGTTLAT